MRWLFRRSSNKNSLKRLLKDAPITYKLNDKGNEIRLFGQSFYRTDPTETILNPDHTSIILYGHNGKNIYGIFGDGLLETGSWKNWSDKQFNNKDINNIHVSPFYKARIVLRIPRDVPIDLSGVDYEVIDADTIAIDYRGANNNVLYVLPQGSTILSIETIQSSKKEYFGPIIIEPCSSTERATGVIDKIFKTVIALTVALALVLLLYACLRRREIVIVEPLPERRARDMQVPV